MEIYYNQLVGRELDYAVARAVGYRVHVVDVVIGGRERAVVWISRPQDLPEHWINLVDFRPSVDWRYGGPIFERYICGIGQDQQSGDRFVWHNDDATVMWAPTLLIATMRAVVANSSICVDDRVDIPKEVIDGTK